jgi:hypothetical protein
MSLLGELDVLFVPSGGPAMFQPLDWVILGDLKSRIRATSAPKTMEQDVIDIDSEKSVSILLQCWDSISEVNSERHSPFRKIEQSPFSCCQRKGGEFTLFIGSDGC